MNKFLFAAALIVSGLLVGCNQLTQYTITEQEINQSLAKHNNFSKDIGLPGVADAHICSDKPDQPNWSRRAE